MSFRKSFLAAFALSAVCLNPLPAAADITITDIVGRTVTLEKPAERILLGEGRQLIALSPIEPDIGNKIVGWLGDLQRLDPASYQLYREKYPNLDKVPQVGVTSEETFSVEKALSVRPDIAILSGGHGPSSDSTETIRQLEAAGIPVIFVDFRNKPLENTIPSLKIMAQALGREAESQAFIEFYENRMKRISDRLAAHPDLQRPKVLMEMFAGSEDCCGSPGRGNLGEFIDFVGGHNIGADVLQAPLGPISLEYIVSQNPEVYIGTGSSQAARGVVLVGAGVEEEATQESLKKAIAL
ncbi:ABC transporter substrate-binding protein [Telmatospirillum sp. J64-1]|uniref:ABC transporter substrate-binding protein n=1 Tax=Telmatospirillum sp. J64-1 TaxID=2502183 RepID=UPI00163D47C1|nr:ABC transporter substrate-binding protein [Telmatospirillum sp. J64-1]